MNRTVSKHFEKKLKNILSYLETDIASLIEEVDEEARLEGYDEGYQDGYKEGNEGH